MCPPSQKQQSHALPMQIILSLKPQAKRLKKLPSSSSYAADVGVWAEERSLEMSAQKSTVTLFMPHTQHAHFHPAFPQNGAPFPHDRNPKILGVTYDPVFHFHKHVDNIVNKAKPRVDILRSLCVTNWGQQHETKLDTFKSVIRPLFTYAAPKWFQDTNQAWMNKLQVVQNSALRT